MFKFAVQQIKPVAENPLQAFYTDNFQLFDIIEVVLSQVSQCKQLTLTSFSISEEFVRKIFRFREQFALNDVVLFLDTKAATKVSKLNLFLKNTFDEVYLINNHGKVILFDSDPQVSICTSQNQTRGNRKESHVISTDLVCFQTFTTAIQEMKQTAVRL